MQGVVDARAVCFPHPSLGIECVMPFLILMGCRVARLVYDVRSGDGCDFTPC